MQIHQALDLYLSTASALRSDWGLYAVVALGLLGFVFSRNNGLVWWHIIMLAVVFVIFASGNLVAIINKSSLHAALAHEVVAANTEEAVSSDELSNKLSAVVTVPIKKLHAAIWQVQLAVHLLIDVIVLIAMLLSVRW